MREQFQILDFHKEMLIESFKKKNISLDENSMITILNNENSTFTMKRNAAIMLREIGTDKSLKSLKLNVHSRNKDLQAICILTIAQINGIKESKYFISLLEGKRIQKGYVLWALFAIDSKNQIQEIQDYLYNCVKVDKRASSKKLSQIEHGLVLIENYGSNSIRRNEILEFYKMKWNSLSYQQQRILEEHTDFFKIKPI